MSCAQVKQPEVANNIETCRHLRTCTLLITIYPRLLLDSFTYVRYHDADGGEMRIFGEKIKKKEREREVMMMMTTIRYKEKK